MFCVYWVNLTRTISQQTQNMCITFVQRRPSVKDVGSMFYKCYTNVLCFAGMLPFTDTGRIIGTIWRIWSF